MPNTNNSKSYKFKKLFDPVHMAPDLDETQNNPKGQEERESHIADFRVQKDKNKINRSDRRDGKLYHYSDHIIEAINVAIATGRPLLVRGPSGSGKSSLAYNVARVLGARFYQFVVTSRSQAEDLLFEFEALNRLADAQAGLFDTKAFEKVKDISGHTYFPYIKPGKLWWAIDKESAENRGLSDEKKKRFTSSLASLWREVSDPIEFSIDKENKDDCEINSDRAVVLIDEIDKADPDFPNNLLVPLGSFKFTVPYINEEIELKSSDTLLDYPLIIITTNEERRLPDAFLRRCISLTLQAPPKEELLQIAIANEGPEDEDTYEKIYSLMKPEQGSSNNNFNVAEYLDAVRAYHRLDGKLGDDENESFLNNIIQITSASQITDRSK